MHNLDIKLIRKLNRLRFRQAVKKTLSLHYNKAISIALIILLTYCIYFVLILKSNFDSARVIENNVTLLPTTRKLYLLFALFMSNLITFYSRKELLKAEVMSLMTYFPQIKFPTLYLFAHVPIIKTYLAFMFLIALPSYISFYFFNISFIVIICEILALLLSSFLYYCIMTTINIFLAAKRTSFLTKLLTFLISNAFLAYFINLLTNSRYFLLYFLPFALLLFGFLFRELYAHGAKIFYECLYNNEQTKQKKLKYLTTFHQSHLQRYLQFDLKRILFESLIKDYLFTLVSLVIAYILTKIFVPLEYTAMFNFIIASFGIVELQVIFSTSLGVFLAKKASLLQQTYINVSRYFLSTATFYMLLNCFVSFFLNLIFFGKIENLLFFFLNIITAITLSLFLSYIFSYFITKNIYLIVINIIVINILHTLLSYLIKDNLLYLGLLLLTISLFSILFLNSLLKKQREAIK